MKDIPKLFDIINKSKITQRDRFVLQLILSLSVLIESIGVVMLVRQLPDFVEWILKALHIL
jgi:hypothetical protein